MAWSVDAAAKRRGFLCGLEADEDSARWHAPRPARGFRRWHSGRRKSVMSWAMGAMALGILQRAEEAGGMRPHAFCGTPLCARHMPAPPAPGALARSLAACPRPRALEAATLLRPDAAKPRHGALSVCMQQQPRDTPTSASETMPAPLPPPPPDEPVAVGAAAWLLVGVLLLTNIHQQWTRALVFYLVSFKVPATEESARLYMNIDLGFGESDYGLLASFGFTLLFTACSLVAGRAADSGNRVGITAAAAAGWSLATMAQGVSSSFENVLASRGLMGLSQAFTNPAAYGLIASTFPEARVSTANSIYSSAVYVGGALASLTILLDNSIGWRDSSLAIGGAGLVLALASAAILKDPEARPGLWAAAPGTKEEAHSGARAESSPRVGGGGLSKEVAGAVGAAKQVLEIPFVQLLFAATACRFAAGYGIGVWKAPFFREAFPQFQDQFSVANALVISGGGVLSSLAGGAIADRFAPGDARVRLWIPAAGSLLAVPLWLGTCYADSFYGSIGMLFGEYLVAECWFGPTLAALYRAVPKEVQGTAQGLFSVLTALGNVMPVAIGALQESRPLPQVLAGTISAAYVASGLLFFAASTRVSNEVAGGPERDDV